MLLHDGWWGGSTVLMYTVCYPSFKGTCQTCPWQLPRLSTKGLKKETGSTSWWSHWDTITWKFRAVVEQSINSETGEGNITFIAVLIYRCTSID